MATMQEYSPTEEIELLREDLDYLRRQVTETEERIVELEGELSAGEHDTPDA